MEMDERMLDAYRYALSHIEEPKKLKKSQSAWIKKRNLCQDELCLEAIYKPRIEELTTLGHLEENRNQDIFNQNKKEATLNNRNLGFCKKLAELYTIHQLDYVIPTDNSKGFEAVYEGNDIDLDGSDDSIVIEGGVRYSSIEVLLSSGKRYNSTGHHSINLIKYNAKLYLINYSLDVGGSKSIMYFESVDWLSPDGVKTVCDYKDIMR